jgi:mono/diheme cytochrome c family protein
MRQHQALTNRDRKGAALPIACLLLGSLFTLAQAQKRTTLDGVYSDAQAARGAELFAAKCARCHEGADVDGPPLTQDPFLDRWREDSLAPLYTFLKTKMPQDAPGSLTETNYLDLLAAILAKNTFPAGRDLTADTLASITLVGHDGPKPIPNSAAVVAVGCFNAGSPNTFSLTNAADLGRTQTPDETNPEELKNSAAKPLGTRTFGLMNVSDLAGFNLDGIRGRKVQAKGVLQRQPAGDRINVLSLEVLAPTCP